MFNPSLVSRVLACSQAERMDLMCKCQRQEQQVADLRKLVDDIAKLESGAPDVAGGDNGGNWETQSVCSDVSGVSGCVLFACVVCCVYCRVPPAFTKSRYNSASSQLYVGRSEGQCVQSNLIQA